MAQPDHSRLEALTLIRALNDRLESEQTILASPEDCDYFRNIYRTLSRTSTNVPETPPIDRYEIQRSPSQDSIQQAPKIKEVPKNELSQPIAKEISSDLIPPQKQSIEQPPPPVPTAIEKPISNSPEMTIDPPAPRAPQMGFDDIRKIMSRSFPDLLTSTDIPNDAPARHRAERWKTKNQAAPISVITFNESDGQHQFLTNLMTAIEVVFGQTRLIAADAIEKEKQWETFLAVPDLKLIIICDYALWQMPNLLQYYREVPNRSERLLQNTNVLLLPDLTLYQKDPLLKRSLWKAICQKINASL